MGLLTELLEVIEDLIFVIRRFLGVEDEDNE